MYKTLDQKKDLALDIERHLAPLVKRIEALEQAARDSRQSAIEECAKAVESERLQSPTDLPEDKAYDQAIRDAAEAVRALVGSPKS